MSKKPHSRSAARAKAFQVLYGLEFAPVTSLGALRDAFCETPDPTDADMDASGSTPGPNTAPETAPDTGLPTGFAWELTHGVWSRGPELDELISRHAQNWRVERLGKIELILLRLAMFELMHRLDVPIRVAINEALELTARFGDAKAKRFINGILDAASKHAPARATAQGSDHDQASAL